MTGLIYERGEPAQPAGHAFLYFGHRGDQQVLATYLVVPPITMDLAKYMPPMFVSSLGATGGLTPTASFLPIPPVPESIELGHILGMAELRGDDILVAGPPAPGSEPSALLAEVIEIGEAYAQSYQASVLPNVPTEAEETARETQEDSPHVRALMYATVSERERLEALGRELGTVRYGLETSDPSTVETALAELRAIAASLPGKFRAQDLVEVAGNPDARSVRLTQLYLERGYRLCNEAYEELPQIDAEIALLRHEIERPS